MRAYSGRARAKPRRVPIPRLRKGAGASCCEPREHGPMRPQGLPVLKGNEARGRPANRASGYNAMMLRRLRAVCLPALVALGLGVAILGGARAEGKTPPAVLGTPEEREAIALFADSKHLTARTRAEALLREDPDSIVGHYVLGSV